MATILRDLKKVRSELGITQMDLARQSHVSLPTIQNIESDRANPAVQTLQAIANQLGLEIKVTIKQANWDLFAFYGAPLSTKASVKQVHLSKDGMLPCLREACLELTYSKEMI